MPARIKLLLQVHSSNNYLRCVKCVKRYFKITSTHTFFLLRISISIIFVKRLFMMRCWPLGSA